MQSEGMLKNISWSLRVCKDIAEQKMPDLNAFDIEGAMKIIEGTAKSMGLTVID